jgi:hypothetical protein
MIEEVVVGPEELPDAESLVDRSDLADERLGAALPPAALVDRWNRQRKRQPCVTRRLAIGA